MALRWVAGTALGAVLTYGLVAWRGGDLTLETVGVVLCALVGLAKARIEHVAT